MEKLITRTINSATCKAIVVSMNKEGKPVTSEREIVIPVAFATDNDKADKYIRKNVTFAPGEMFAGIREINTTGALVGMPESTFIQHARKVDERDKTTRGTITKEVESYYAHAIVIKPDGNAEEIHAIPALDDVEKARAWLKRNVYKDINYFVVTHISVEKALYSMAVDVFMEHAKPVARRNHLEK